MEYFDVEIQGPQPEKKKIQKAQVNFRAPEDMAAWIKERSKETGQTQEDFLNAVVEEYMLRVREEEFPSRGIETAEYRAHLLALNRMFVASLDLCENTENRVREEFRLQMETKDRTITNYQEQVAALKDEKSSLQDAVRRSEELQRDLDAARARVGEVEADAKQRMDDLRTTNDSLMGDKKRLEAEIQRYQEQIAGMQTAVASYEAMRSERDAAMAKIEEERRAAQEAQKQAMEATKQAMQDQIVAVNERLHESVVAQAAAQAEANSLREFKVANDRLHETVGEQKAQIAMLETQIDTLEEREEKYLDQVGSLQEMNRALTEQLKGLQFQIQKMKEDCKAGADGQTAIEGI